MDWREVEILEQFYQGFVKQRLSEEPGLKERDVSDADGIFRFDVNPRNAHITYTRTLDGQWTKKTRTFGEKKA